MLIENNNSSGDDQSNLDIKARYKDTENTPLDSVKNIK